jgi:hypothetical protein
MYNICSIVRGGSRSLVEAGRAFREVLISPFNGNHAPFFQFTIDWRTKKSFFSETSITMVEGRVLLHCSENINAISRKFLRSTVTFNLFSNLFYDDNEY